MLLRGSQAPGAASVLPRCIHRKLGNALKVSADAAFSDCVIGACETKSFLVQQKLSSLTKEEQFVILRLIDSSIESIRKAPSIFSGK